MSLSKLESLPNEILMDFLEKHANGVDILVAFAKQLNSRIDGLIAQCQQLRFDFIRCRKDNFLLCVSLFPLLIDKISELALLEWDTPGQINTFLSFFPSFRPFKTLRTLYFHFDAATITSKEVDKALGSLRNLKNLNTLSIKVAHALEAPLMRIIVELFCLPTLKRLSVAIGEGKSEWTFMNPWIPDSFNIEHLTITGMPFQWNDLQLIIQCSRHLRYVNVRLTKTRLYLSQEGISIQLDYVPNLQTLILHFEEDDPTTFDMVAKLLRATYNICWLELTVHDALIKASAWEHLIQNALPHLTHFLLRTSSYRLKKRILEEVLISFRTSFWVAKNNFYILILDDEHLLNSKDTMNHICGRKQQTSNHENTEFRTALVHPIN
ncbi:unnamed protein product, partial [Rotaria sp. Silwood2]